MTALHRLTAGAALAAALLAAPLEPASAEVTILFSSGGASHAGKHSHRGFGRHRFDSHPRSHSRHRFGSHPRSHQRHRFESRPHKRFGAYDRFPYSSGKPHHRHGPSRHGHSKGGFGTGCRIVTQKSYDAHGRRLLLRRTLCHDRHGRPYILGGH